MAKIRPLDQRQKKRLALKVWMRLEKAHEELLRLRDEAQRHQHLDQVQFLTETIASIARAKAHFRYYTRNDFHTQPEELAGYR